MANELLSKIVVYYQYLLLNHNQILRSSLGDVHQLLALEILRWAS